MTSSSEPAPASGPPLPRRPANSSTSPRFFRLEALWDLELIKSR